MLQKWLKSLHKAVNNVIYTIHYFLPYVSKHRLYFGNRNVAYNEIRLKRTWKHCYVPFLFNSILLFRFLLILIFFKCLNTPEKRAMLFVEFFPPRIQFDYECLAGVACFLPLLNTWYILRLNSRNLHVLALWLVEPSEKNCISPQQLKLTQWEYNKFSQFRTISFLLLDCCTGGFWAGSVLLYAYLIYYKSLIQISPFWTLLWIVLGNCEIPFLIATICMVPFMIIFTAFYVDIRQRYLSNQFDLSIQNMKQRVPINSQSQPTNHLYFMRVMNHNRHYATLLGEVQCYNRLIGRCLDSLFLLDYAMISTFLMLTHDIFISKMSLIFRVFILLGTGQAFLWLGLLISFCARVPQANKQMLQRVRHFHQLGIGLQILTSRQLFKLSNLLQLLTNLKPGFSIRDGYVVNSNTFVLFIYGISVFFFLYYKKIKIE